MALILYNSASAGTGSSFDMSQQYDMGLVVFVPSASYGAGGVMLVGKLVDANSTNTNGTASFSPLTALSLAATNNTAQTVTLTAGGLYYYQNVGGLAVKVVVDSVDGQNVIVAANPILKR